MKPSISGSEMHDESSDSMTEKKGVFFPKPEIPPPLPPLSEDVYDEVKFWAGRRLEQICCEDECNHQQTAAPGVFDRRAR